MKHRTTHAMHAKPCITMPHQAKLFLLSVISPAFLFPKAYSIDPKREIALNQNPDSSISLRCILIKSHKCLISPGWPRHWVAFSETRKKLSSGTIILFRCQNKTLREILDFNDDWRNSACYIRSFNSFYKLQWQLALACKKLTNQIWRIRVNNYYMLAINWLAGQLRHTYTDSITPFITGHWLDWVNCGHQNTTIGDPGLLRFGWTLTRYQDQGQTGMLAKD